MWRIGARPLQPVFLVLTCAIGVAAVAVSVGHEDPFDTVLYPLHGMALGLCGVLIVRHQRVNPVGWVLGGTGLEAVVVELAEGYGYHPSWPWVTQVEWFGNWANSLGIGTTAVFLTLFPTGHGLSRTRRLMVWTGSVATAMMAAGSALGHSNDPAYATGVNPYALDGLEPLYNAGQVLFLGTLLAAIGSLVLRFRRAHGVERQQLKWVVSVVCLLAVIGPLATFFYYDSALVRIAIAFVVVALPVAICVAILRYRLNDIDVVINRTVVYGSLTVLLAAGYLTTVLVLGAALGGRSSWVTATATLAAAVAFRPLRAWIQDAVDRRFRRDRYDALARVDAFLDDLRAGRADPDALEQVLREVTAEADLRVRYLLPGDDATVTDDRTQRLVERAGAPLAMVEPAPAESVLLGEVLQRAGLALQIGRLRAEVRRQLAEVQASRARIVAAGYEERRRLERDLHDGAQQRLVSIGLALRNAQFQLGDSPVVAAIDRVIDELTTAIGDLRELANGVRPASLDNGLEMALRELAGRTPLPVTVAAGAHRFPTAVEATAYFVACEALTNAVKHAAATGVELRVEPRDGHVAVTVRDDGVGGAEPSRGTGLRGLADRVAAQGGRLHIQSHQGSGTTVIAELPCAW